MSNPKNKPKTKRSSARGNGKHLSRAEEKEKLRTLKIVKVEAQRNRGVNLSQIMTLEDGSQAIFRPASGELAGRDVVERTRKIRLREVKMPMTDLEKARELFRQAGLAFPTIPKQLAARLKERGEWVFATREVKIWPYNLDDYVRESHDAPGDYAVLCHSGHGVNSYAIQYYLVYGPLRMFLYLNWGGVFMDADETAKIRECFSLADQIVQAAMTMNKLKAGEPVTIVVRSEGGYWFISGQSRQQERWGSKGPAEVLTEVLHWLKSPPPNQSLRQTEPA